MRKNQTLSLSCAEELPWEAFKILLHYLSKNLRGQGCPQWVVKKVKMAGTVMQSKLHLCVHA